jgi:osmotically-inducible protein OsmY
MVVFVALSICAGAETQPSDQTIVESVQREIDKDIRLRDADIKVRSCGGIVTLAGEAPSFFDKHRAERLCMQVDGVRRVVSKVEVGVFSKSDKEIAEEIDRRLKADSLLRSRKLGVQVERHVVTLRGVTTCHAEKSRAGRVARQVQGVNLVHNEIEVRLVADRADGAVEEAVIAALQRDAHLSGWPVFVEVKRGVVILNGVVGDVFQKVHAGNRAKGVAGVREVDNRIVIDALEKTNRPSSEREAKLAQTVNKKLHSDLRLDASHIAVTCDAGFVVLRGTVRSDFQRELAAAKARGVAGVRLVANQLIVEDGQ